MWSKDAGRNQAKKIFHLIVPYTRGDGLDLGSGPYKPYAHMIGIDRTDQAAGETWKNNLTMDARDLSIFRDMSMSFVFSSFLLHYLPEPKKVLKEWWRVIKKDGHLVLYLPDRTLVPAKGLPGADEAAEHWWVAEDVIKIMEAIPGWDVVECQRRDQGDEYGFFLVFKKICGSHRKMSYLDRYKGKRACVVRYGGIGDMIQTASVVAGLYDQGYRVTLNCHPNGEDLMRHDPHIYEFRVQDKDQVPNPWLPDYWKALAKEFDHFVNLSETVEGTLLAFPDRANHRIPKEARHLIMNVNYLDFMHAVGGCPEAPKRPFFYPSDKEKKEAEAYREKLGADTPVVMIALAGSSIHKTYERMDWIVMWLLEHSNVKIVLTGGPMEQMLEEAILQQQLMAFMKISHEASHEMGLSNMLLKLKEHFGGVNRVICQSGRWTERQALTFAHYANCVVGPETGVLNAVSMKEVEKVIMLSHSTVENLTRDWLKCTAMVPTSACYPCHMMHYDHTYCPRDERSHAAVCTTTIEPEGLFRAIIAALQRDDARRPGAA